MAEADEKLQQMLEIGHKMVKFGIDPKTNFYVATIRISQRR